MQDDLRLIVQAAPVAIVVADERGAIILVNEQGERLFGYDHDELLGRTIETLVPSRFRTAHPGLRSSYLQAPIGRPMGAGRDLYGLRRDGTEVPIEIGLGTNLIGPPDVVRDRLRAYRDCGVTTLRVNPIGSGLRDCIAGLETLLGLVNDVNSTAERD